MNLRKLQIKSIACIQCKKFSDCLWTDRNTHYPTGKFVCQRRWVTFGYVANFPACRRKTQFPPHLLYITSKSTLRFSYVICLVIRLCGGLIYNISVYKHFSSLGTIVSRRNHFTIVAFASL